LDDDLPSLLPLHHDYDFSGAIFFFFSSNSPMHVVCPYAFLFPAALKPARRSITGRGAQATTNGLLAAAS